MQTRDAPLWVESTLITHKDRGVKTSQHWALFAQGSHPWEGWRDSTIPCRKLLPHLGKPTWLPWPPCPVVPKPASGALISKYKIWSSRLSWGTMWWMVLSISACPSEPVIPQKSESAIFLNYIVGWLQVYLWRVRWGHGVDWSLLWRSHLSGTTKTKIKRQHFLQVEALLWLEVNWCDDEKPMCIPALQV